MLQRDSLKRGLMLFERIVLESLVRSSKNLKQLSDDVGIEREVLNKIIKMLISREFIIKKGYIYSLCSTAYSNIKLANCNEYASKEIETLLSNSVLEYFNGSNNDGKSNLNVKKISMTPGEVRLFNDLLNNLNDFVRRVESKNRDRGRVRDQQVIFYGNSLYDDLVKRSLS